MNGERQKVDGPPYKLPAAAVNVAAMYCALATTSFPVNTPLPISGTPCA